MKTFKPFQLSFQSQIIQQDGKYFFTVSTTLGTHLLTGERYIEPDWLRDALEGMGEVPLPDSGMPKLSGEYLVSGDYFAPEGVAVPAGEITVKLGKQEKQLLVFGPREWQGGFPSTPEAFSSLAINYNNAFGGKAFENNPDGLGYKESPLPRIELPNQIITSASEQPDVAGFSVINPGWPQRAQYQGTYDERYLERYFPGYPADFDWRYFHCAPQDQWHSEYYHGDESFEISNMHSKQRLLRGKLPGLYARCFINRTDASEKLRMTEIDLNLDTIWFFPQQELVLQTWRSTVEVSDDEASQIKHVLLAYERRSDVARSLEHYEHSLNTRINSDDPLLNNFKTKELIPQGDKTAMALLFETALENTEEESELSKNMTAKADIVQKHVEEQLGDANKQLKDHMPVSAASKGQALPDIDKLLDKKSDLKPDAEVAYFKQRLDEILPGLSSGNPKLIDFSNFSFKCIDDIMTAMNQLMDKKQTFADKEIVKLKEHLGEQMGSLSDQLGDVPAEEKKKLENLLKGLDSMGDKAKHLKTPLPRLEADRIISSMSEMNPDSMESLFQLQTLKGMGVDNEQTQQLEALLGSSMEERNKKVELQLYDAEQDFKELYSKTAHFMDDGIPANEENLDEVAQRLLANPKQAAEKDWACIDLSNQVLDGIDLSGAYLEQVDFSGASLVGANLSGAILARAKLNGANLSGANLEAANVGAVTAIKCNFTGANFHQAKLSKGNFSEANFTDAILTETETLEITIDRANFTNANLTGLKIIERELKSVNFTRANLETSCFLQSSISDANFESADMPRCVWADTSLVNSRFSGANLSSNCFAVTEDAQTDGTVNIENNDFSHSRIEKSSFQNMVMPKTNFHGATVINCNFNGADLSASDLSQADMQQCQFRKAKLTGANLKESNFDQAFFSKAHLVSADLSGSNFYGVDFLGITVGETKFDGCNLDATIMKDWRPG
jgi:uncharacterized protein YjbI with pentapeptide repeats